MNSNLPPSHNSFKLQIQIKKRAISSYCTDLSQIYIRRIHTSKALFVFCRFVKKINTTYGQNLETCRKTHELRVIAASILLGKVPASLKKPSWINRTLSPLLEIYTPFSVNSNSWPKWAMTRPEELL